MFANQSNCTVWEKGIENRMEVYTPHVFGYVYCQKTTAQTVQNVSREPDDSFLFIIHEKEIPYLPKPDDKIKAGNCPETSPPNDALTVNEVRDFRFGSERVSHIEVIAK